MVSGQEVARTAGAGRTLHHVDPGPVVPLHVEVGSHKVGWPPATQVPCNCQCLEKDLRHQHRTAPVKHHSPMVEIWNRSRQPAEVTVAGAPDGSPVAGGVLMNDFGT